MSRVVLTSPIGSFDFVIDPYRPTFSRMWPRTRDTYPLSIRTTSSFAMEPICSFQSERMIVAVSSPMTASATLRASPYLPMTSLPSPTFITFA